MAGRRQSRDVPPNRTKIWLGVIGVLSAVGVVAVPVMLNQKSAPSTPPGPTDALATSDAAPNRSIEQSGSGQAGIAGRDLTQVQQILPPPVPPKADVKIGAVRVIRNLFRQPSSGPGAMIEDLGSSSVLDVILHNKGTGTGVITGLRVTCVEYQERTAEFGGDDLLNPTAKYFLDLSSLKSPGAAVELPIAHELKAQSADRLLIVATDSSRKNWQEKTSGTWKLRVEFLTTDGDLAEAKDVAIRIPTERPTRGTEETSPASLAANGFAVVPAPPSSP